MNCSAYIAEEITLHFREKGEVVNVIGNESCFDNQVLIDRLLRYATHRNVGAVLIVGHGCEFIQADKISGFAQSRDRIANVIFGQEAGSKATIGKGIGIVEGCWKS
jgi:altronate dehydratase large subunit